MSEPPRYSKNTLMEMIAVCIQQNIMTTKEATEYLEQIHFMLVAHGDDAIEIILQEIPLPARDQYRDLLQKLVSRPDGDTGKRSGVRRP